MVKIGTALEVEAVEFADDAFLLRSEEAYKLLGAASPSPPPLPPPEDSDKPPPPPLESYGEVNVSADLEWKKWSEFHEAVIQPLVNAGATLRVRVEVTGSSEEGIPHNTVDFAIKEGLMQYGITAKVEPKKAGNG
jgi:hypothetical protein